MGEDKTSWGGCPDVDWISLSNAGTPVRQKGGYLWINEIILLKSVTTCYLTCKLSLSTPPLKLRVTASYKHLISFDAWTLGFHFAGPVFGEGLRISRCSKLWVLFHDSHQTSQSYTRYSSNPRPTLSNNSESGVEFEKVLGWFPNHDSSGLVGKHAEKHPHAGGSFENRYHFSSTNDKHPFMHWVNPEY